MFAGLHAASSRLDKVGKPAHFPVMNVFVTSDRKVTVSLDAVVGSFRTFGRVGPIYQVLGVGDPQTGANVVLRVRVVESGEELDYLLSAALDDPLAP